MSKKKKNTTNENHDTNDTTENDTGVNSESRSHKNDNQEAGTGGTKREKKKSIVSNIVGLFSVGCGASILMALYMGTAMLSLYRVMYPLAFLDISTFPDNTLVRPLWDKGTPIHMRLYLSTKPAFSQQFLISDVSRTSVLLLEKEMGRRVGTTITNKEDDDEEDYDDVLSSFSESFLLTSLNCTTDTTNTNNNANTCAEDASYQFATSWLDAAEKFVQDQEESGIFTAMSNAGQGIESTSILLVVYNSMTNNVKALLSLLQIIHTTEEDDDDDGQETTAASTKGDSSTCDSDNQRKEIALSPHSSLWKAITTNSTLYIHAIILRENNRETTTTGQEIDIDVEETQLVLKKFYDASQTNSLLLGQVNLMKLETPTHISKPKRILFHDITYFIRHYLFFFVPSTDNNTTTPHAPPWEMKYAQPEEYRVYEHSLHMKENGMKYPYWKPELSIKYVHDDTAYPYALGGASGMTMIRLAHPAAASSQNRYLHPTGVAYIPALHVDEMGLTSEKYIPLNETVTSLPLRLSFDRNDIVEQLNHHNAAEDKKKKQKKKKKKQKAATTATAGAMSPARWRLLTQLSKGIENQKEMGFEQSDIDDVKRLIADTDVTLLAITMLASALHLLFEFLTFKSEVNFWRNNNDLTGLSVRSLFLDCLGQFIILLYFIDQDSSLLMTIPHAFGCLIAAWKCYKAAGLRFVKVKADVHNGDKKKNTTTFSWVNTIPRLLGYELRATRLEVQEDSNNGDETKKSGTSSSNRKKDRLTLLTIEADRVATSTLGKILLPFVLAYTLYSILYEQHSGWYSWIVSSASSAVYAFGFALMTPQLFLNWKLKSVAHLPWKVLIYKSLNTFIDDLFSFIIRMPTMARISCFRDDVVFFIYLYQRYMYPVDTSRPIEGGGEGTTNEDEKNNQGEDTTKKNQ